jgi:UDP-2,3-diacylglucosamine pyrophosphatase LpxH
MLGNHDVELSLPKPRRRLMERIGRPVEFFYDNEAFTFGQLLVEHGNRYEGWNVVDYDALRQARSRLSRGEPGGEFPTQPGSELVARVMNKLKRRYPWVDLLKPETAGVIPILAALGESTWATAAEAAKAAARASWRQSQFASSGMPTASRFIRATASPTAEPMSHPVDDLADVFELFERYPSQATSSGGDGRMVGAGAVTFHEELLFRGLRMWGEKDGKSFRVDRETKMYLNAAQTLARRDNRKVIVFGHTHHAKRVPLESGAVYLNTGTWADLMRIPEVILSGEVDAARIAFGDFVVALKTDVAALRRQLPTFARIDFDAADNFRAADVLFFDGDGKTTPISNDEVSQRLDS